MVSPMRKMSFIAIVAFFVLAADTKHDASDSPFLHPDLRRIYANENVTGVENAPVTLIAYVNFECPYCADFQANILPRLKEDFVDNGQLKLVYRVFPMTNSLTGNSMLTAELTVCAAQHGYFREVAETLFKHQGEDFWKGYAKWIDESAPEAAAGLKSCIAFHKARHQVIENQQRYAVHEVMMTPTIFINDKQLAGIRSYAEYYDTILAMLDKR